MYNRHNIILHQLGEYSAQNSYYISVSLVCCIINWLFTHPVSAWNFYCLDDDLQISVCWFDSHLSLFLFCLKQVKDTSQK